MEDLKRILENPSEAMTIIEDQAIANDEFVENHLNAWMLGTAVSNVKQLANNMNESCRKLKKILNDNNFDETTNYEIAKCIQLLELNDISLG